MTDFEKAEKLREKTGVNYTEAKEALDNSDGSLLDALVYLEKQGKVDSPPGGGFYSGASPNDGNQSASGKKSAPEADSFSDLIKRFGRFCSNVVDKGMKNCLVASRDGEHLFSIPVIAFAFLLIFFWVTLPVFIITLFFRVRYQFKGPDLERDAVNSVMSSASEMVDEVKKTISVEAAATKEAYEAKRTHRAQESANTESENDNGSDNVIQ